MIDHNIYPIIKEYLGSKDTSVLKEFCQNQHPADLASALEEAPVAEITHVIRALDAQFAAALLAHMTVKYQHRTVMELSDDTLAPIISKMPSDDRVDMLRHVPEGRRQKLFKKLAEKEREDIIKLDSYDEGKAGAIMTSDYVALPVDITAEKALKKMRFEAPDKETIYYAYVVDSERKLLGTVALRNLIMARPSKKLKEIMHTEIISLNAHDPQSEAAELMKKYDLLALPVTNGNEALVFFLPLLIDSGGNAGSQSATLMVRALALGEVKIKHWFRLLGKEVLIAATIGIAMGLAVSLIGFLRVGPEVAVVVAMTMVLTVLFGSLAGMSLPFLLTRFKMDPATASAPLITSIADIGGVLIYFSIATWYLKDIISPGGFG